MMAKCEAVQAWLEVRSFPFIRFSFAYCFLVQAVTYQMCNMTYGEMSENLAG